MKPYYEDGAVTLYHGDCLEILPQLEPASFDLVLIDPPYGETKLDWDESKFEWLDLVRPLLAPPASLWCFGSLRFFVRHALEFGSWSLAQDVIWEKHNGSSSASDRFKRVHELVVQFYPADVA